MSITLRDLVARGTPLDWFESVAIVQELSATVMADAGRDGPRVPDLPGAEIRPDGCVAVTDAGSGDQAPVFRLAHVLNALLSSASPPVQLRLLVLTALSPDPTYKSLYELSQALEYFERPDRRRVIQAVYERAVQLPAVESDVPALPDKPSEPEAKPVENKAAGWRREHLLLAACVPLALAFVAGGWWWSTRPTGARVLAGTTHSVSQLVATAVGAIRNQLGGEPAAAVEVTPTPQPAPRPAHTGKRRVAPRLRPARSLTLDALPPVALAPAAAEAPWTQPGEKVDEVVYLDLPSDPVSPAGPVYSAADAGVQPPVATRPRLPSEPPPGVPVSELTRIEVLVTAAGEVDGVKIVAGPRTSLDGMMLSAVKAWKFQPATRDGRPVAYRHMVWLTTR